MQTNEVVKIQPEDAPQVLLDVFSKMVEYQLESHFAKFTNKQDFANEIKRIYTIGRLTPQLWMQQAVGANISTQPILNEISKIMSK